MFGIEIKFKNGDNTCIYPVSKEPIEEEGLLLILNECNDYTYGIDLDSVDKWSKYDLCNNYDYNAESVKP